MEDVEGGTGTVDDRADHWLGVDLVTRRRRDVATGTDEHQNRGCDRSLGHDDIARQGMNRVVMVFRS